ncbi:MAG TPA: radical SAM family heme chaperone HemW [Fibrobacteraceae bacterium]|nr:radical SAM family heme chaperone HemW [Fibrobacteraceae bacterium]
MGFYVHVPFCAKVCAYCDFAVLAAPERVKERYIRLLLQEAGLRWHREAKGRAFQTAYLGGGTPTELSAAQLERLLSGLRDSRFLQVPFKEFTAECNPESTTQDRLSVLQAAGVDRFSIGIQSFHSSLLQRMGRRATPEQSLEALQRLLSLRQRVTADLLFAAPDQSIDAFLSDLDLLVSQGVGHISFYGLNVVSHTLLGQQVARGEIHVPEDLYAQFYLQGVRYLDSKGIHRYEVSNFSRTRQESLHNLNYWHRGEYLGVGPGAHSFLDGVRSATPRTFARWADWVESGCPREGMELDPLGEEEERVEWIWLGLRLAEGLNLEAYQRRFGRSLEARLWEKAERDGFLERRSGCLHLVGEGWIWMDRIVRELISD